MNIALLVSDPPNKVFSLIKQLYNIAIIEEAATGDFLYSHFSNNYLFRLVDTNW
ncbi:MAG: hypothetical protein IPJ31_11230 [Bacteroidetes bacterium]|nr:hypothetical protein [Bacteroidota bacterium]